ncbi:hypothetical protein [Dictyobacter aurantiacus]|uniref:Uncharacterized protein n=1 Tax=Dictyobacter aurantiacus TaxID=1936993 RepID=A0A401ZEZ4_9CHLR|nr:hypothetical protein [Dictyobacter aurantiacus]GCE05416.1 hypothetical protein KDAU_27450 [Dictyobacter aurantiacus]
MALVLTGVVNGIRPVGGTIEKGPRAGEQWHFLSMEITDPRYGRVYSCQLRSNDRQYKDLVEAKPGKDDKGRDIEIHTLKNDLAGHKVKVTFVSQTAGEREIEDKNTGDKQTILQIRTQVTNLRDLGLPEDDDE